MSLTRSILANKSLIEEHYEEPVDGKYKDATPEILKVLKLLSDDENDFTGEEDSTNKDVESLKKLVVIKRIMNSKEYCLALPLLIFAKVSTH